MPEILYEKWIQMGGRRSTAIPYIETGFMLVLPEQKPNRTQKYIHTSAEILGKTESIAVANLPSDERPRKKRVRTGK